MHPTGSWDSVLGTQCDAQTCWHQASPSVCVAQFTGEQTRLLNVVTGQETLQGGEKSIYDGSPCLDMNQGNNKPSCVHMYFYRLIRIESMCMEANLSSLTRFLKTLSPGGSLTFGLRIMKEWTWFTLWVRDVRPTLRFSYLIHLLSTCSIPGTVVGARDTEVNMTEIAPAVTEFTSWPGRQIIKK